MQLFTIGFTKKNAEAFFTHLKTNDVSTVIDVRLNNVSQLSGFAKRDDLKFFLRKICNADYLHVPDMAPTKEDLNAYKNGNMPWERYAEKFCDLMARRRIEKTVTASDLRNGCLLCSEHEPHYCHRRLVAEYLNSVHSERIDVIHLY